jgi:rod shape determining protein RodA
MLQPDLGTMVMLAFIVGGVILFVGVDRRLLTAGTALVLVAAPLSWFIMAQHQKNRIIAFINPQADPVGIGYNVIQSMVAVGSGKFTGKGYKLGTQTALKYLPERHTDFVFSVLGEEWGFIGSILVLSAFLFILFWGVRIAAGAKDRFGALTALGVVLMIFFHTVINIAMTAGVFPVVGIPLPFMSYGGTFLISVLSGIGLLMSIEGRRFMF